MTGIPPDSSIYAYSTDHVVGGVLLTSPPITHQRYYYVSPLKKWVKQNAVKILQRWPEVQDHGLWIVNSTHATKKCAIKMWKNRERFEVGFSTDGGGDWYIRQTDEGWGEYTAEVSTLPIHRTGFQPMSIQDTDKYVIFFGGLKFQYTRRLISGKVSGPLFRVGISRLIRSN